MEKRQLHSKAVSLLGFGCMRLPSTGDNAEHASKNIDYEHTKKMINHAYENGVNYFDTAYVYHGGESEACLGKLLAKYPRNSYYIADKYPIWLAKTHEDHNRIFGDQLQRLGMDYIDFYLIHSLERQHLGRLRELRIYEHFAEEKKRGRIKNLGFSFHDAPDVLEEIVNEYDWDFVQIQMNYLDWSYQDVEKLYKILEEKNIPVIVMEPIRGGYLADPSPEATEYIAGLTPKTTPASLALRWVAQHENVKVILSGMSNMDQMKENVEIFGNYIPVTANENAAAQKVVEMISNNKTIPCTGCGYCMDCPSGVDIPELFKIYNHYKTVDDGFRTGIQYTNYFDKSKKPENCTECGLCVSQCPQHINIPECLKNVRDTLNALNYT